MFVEKLSLFIAIFHSENLSVTLIARFLFYVVVVSCFSHVNHAFNYPWFRVSACTCHKSGFDIRRGLNAF
jgi:hypothetical protein